MALLGKRLSRFLRSILPGVVGYTVGGPIGAAAAAGGTSLAKGKGLGNAAKAAGLSYLGGRVGSSLIKGIRDIAPELSSSVANSAVGRTVGDIGENLSGLIPGKESISSLFGQSGGAATGTAEDAFLARATSAAGGSGASGGLAPGLESFLKNNSGLINVAGIGAQALKGNKLSGAEKNLRAGASRAGQMADTLTNPLLTGQLPQGVQDAISEGAEAQKAAIRSKYAGLGMSGSTAETQELNNVDRFVSQQKFTYALDLANAGLSQAQIANETYRALANGELQNDQALQDAIARLAGNMGSSQGGAA